MNPSVFIILTIFILSVSADQVQEDNESDDEIFNEYVQKYNIRFRRKVNFTEAKENVVRRVKTVREQNRRYQQGLETFNRSVYPFAHLSDDDFGEFYLGALEVPEQEKNYINQTDVNRRGRLATPPETYFRWSESVTGKVKSQGQCGACYAFAAIGVIKSRRVVKYGGSVDTYDLSEQDAMECTRGCRGGWDYLVYRDYSQVHDGCAAYNYQKLHSYSGIAYSCQANSRPRVPNTKVLKYGYLQNNEEIIRQYLYNYGPLYTRFNVYSNFYDYSGGIYTTATGSYVGGHAVIFVGYGVENGQKYWIIKNSWDTWWGEDGYFRMARGTNLCGIEASVSVITDI